MTGWAATNTLREELRNYHTDIVGRPTRESWDALALVEAALDAAERVNGYGENGETIWQLGAGQDWQAWHEEKERLRAALRAVREGAAQRVCMICGQPANVSVCDRCCE